MGVSRPGLRGQIWALWVVTAIAAMFVAAASRAQDDVVSDEESEIVSEEEVVVAPAVPAAGPIATDTAPPMRRSYLAWLYQSLGLLYSVIFLALSFSLVAVFVMNLLVARRNQVMPQGLIDGFEAHLNAKQYQEAYELARHDDSFLGKVLSAGLSRLSAGYEPAIEAMQEVGEEESMRLEHNLSYLALIGNIAPMFGLLGTVDGMVQAST
jgi:biopolymer transport protein ExbB